MARRKIKVEQLDALKSHLKADVAEGRKWQLLEILIAHDGQLTMDEAVKEMTAVAGSEVDNKNVSSLLHYLRQDEGYGIPPAKGGIIRLIHGPITKESTEVEVYCSDEEFEAFLAETTETSEAGETGKAEEE